MVIYGLNHFFKWGKVAATSEFKIDVLISNKPDIKDPEGETILQDLFLRNNFDDVTSVKTAKVIQLIIKANNIEDAKSRALSICDELRIYNPLVSICNIRSSE
jgi:phosphoribosylformylglycinamidine synthase|tara:strand:- start:801 stop:1109 length:309 start_codon:yes stop_codon:yes gene_type:complete